MGLAGPDDAVSRADALEPLRRTRRSASRWLYPLQWPKTIRLLRDGEVDTVEDHHALGAARRHRRGAIERVLEPRGRRHQDGHQTVEAGLGPPVNPRRDAWQRSSPSRRSRRSTRRSTRTSRRTAEAGVEGMGIWEFKLRRGQRRGALWRACATPGSRRRRASPASCPSTRCRSPGRTTPRSGSRRCAPPSTASRPSSRR